MFGALERNPKLLPHPVENRYLSVEEEKKKEKEHHLKQECASRNQVAAPEKKQHIFEISKKTQRTKWSEEGDREGTAAASSAGWRTELDSHGEAWQAASALRTLRQERGVRCQPEPVTADMEKTGLQSGVPPIQTQ